MSEENVELARRGYEAYLRGDLTEVLATLDPGVITYRADPDGRSYHGPEGFLQAVADWVEDFEDFTVTPVEFIDANDSQIIVHVHQRARGARSGAPIEGDFWFVHTIREGRLTRLDMFLRETQAREAAGLEH